MNRIFKSWRRLVVLTPLIFSLTSPAEANTKESAKNKQSSEQSSLSTIAPADLKLLNALDETYRSKSMSMKVTRVSKVPSLGMERKTTGTLWISKGRLRMELDGDQKSLLIVNKKNLWAVTYPDPDFDDGKIQVIRADTTSKKGRSQSLLTLLSQGGFLKFFIASAVEKQKNGEMLFFLTPREEQVDFKRAQIKVSADGKQLIFLKYWDANDNEVEMTFSEFKKESFIDNGKFEYTPPANADVISM